ncbi:MAG: transposase family protein [bacterium]
MKEAWLDLKTVAEIKEITTRALRLAIQKGKYKTRETITQGGKSFEILLSSLEPKVQDVYKNTYYQEVLELEKQIIPITKLEPNNENFIPDSAKKIALARLDLLNEWQSFRIKYKPKQAGDKLFLDLYNSGEYLKTIYELLGRTSRGSLLRWNKLYTDYESWEALAPQYKYSGFQEYRTVLAEEQIAIFLKLLLHPNQFNIGKAIKLSTHILERRGSENIPKPITFRRYAEWFKKNNYDKWILMREGEKSLVDKISPYIKRDISKLAVGDVIIADGHVLNFLLINPFTGKPVRATLVGFLDWKSGYLVGYEIMMQENTQCIAAALRMAIITMDMLPKIVYQDNGRAFKAKYFSQSADFSEAGFNGIYENLGIKPVYARPYNAKAKVIERFFKEFQEEFEKLVPSYSGSSIEMKPAHLKRNEKFHKELHNKVNKGYVPTIEEAIKLINAWLDFRHSQPCPNDKSRSIKDVFDSREKQNIDKNKLDDLMLAYEVKTIHRNGIRFLNFDYYHDNLYGLRDRVMIKYSLFDLTKIKVYSTKGEYICTAKRITGTHPMAYHLGEIKDMEDFKQKIQKQKKFKNKTLKAVKKYLPKEDIKFLEVQMDSEYLESTPDVEIKNEPLMIETQIKPVFMNNYERYEWFIKNGCSTSEDRQWLANYKQSDEYKLIYED